MGVEWDDCDVVAELLGTKTFLNEFVAYISLSEYINNRTTLNGLRTISVSTLISNIIDCVTNHGSFKTWLQSLWALNKMNKNISR